MKIKSNLKELLLYLIVGGIATAAEWLLFYLFDQGGLHYAIATLLAYLLSTLVNWAAGRILVFKKSAKPLWQELGGIYLASIGGLLLNVLLMFLAVELLGLPEMLSKIGATGIVFLYNYLVRKFWIYK